MLEDDFCDIIRKARFGLGLSSTAVARGVAITEDRLGELESPSAAPTEDEVARLSAVLSLRARQLSDIAFGRYVPAVSPNPGIIPVYVPEGNAFAYAVTAGGRRVIIDAGGSAAQLLEAVGGSPAAVLLTHGHHDHVDALSALRGAAEVYAHPDLAARIPGARPLHDGEQAFGFTARYAPGHSADMLTLVGDGFAFVGDTMFAGSLGRAQSPAAYGDLLSSARDILGLPKDTLLFAGHGPVTSVGEELAHNAFPVA